MLRVAVRIDVRVRVEVGGMGAVKAKGGGGLML